VADRKSEVGAGREAEAVEEGAKFGGREAERSGSERKRKVETGNKQGQAGSGKQKKIWNSWVGL
jgi:hypothetical protein